jgi:hydrogenase nickel incorporation protein HypA/HybF
MHEFGLAEGILEAVQARAGGRRVAWVRVRAGVRHGVDEPSMAQAFGLLAVGTEAAGANLELVQVPVQMHCWSCGHTGPTGDLLAICPTCQGEEVELTGGDELTLESIGYQPATAG